MSKGRCFVIKLSFQRPPDVSDTPGTLSLISPCTPGRGCSEKAILPAAQSALLSPLEQIIDAT